MVSFRVGRCASSAAKTGSCFADESVALRFAVRIPLEIIARNFSLLFQLEMSKGEFFMNKAQALTRRQRTYRLVSIGILVATEIVCNRFLSVNTSLFKIGVAFLPVVLAAWLYGPVAGALVGGLGDLIGALLFPIGPYFPGFTLTAALAGAGYGFCLCPRCGYALHAKQRKKRAVICCASPLRYCLSRSCAVSSWAPYSFGFYIAKGKPIGIFSFPAC